MSTLKNGRHEIRNFMPANLRAGVTLDVDRHTFNYGRALGKPLPGNNPWDASDPGLMYARVEAYARALGSIAMTMSAAAWNCDMALRDVRNACTQVEQSAALARLHSVFLKTDKSTERLAAGGIQFYRYGRIGNVLRHFTPKGEH